MSKSAEARAFLDGALDIAPGTASGIVVRRMLLPQVATPCFRLCVWAGNRYGSADMPADLGTAAAAEVLRRLADVLEGDRA